MHTTTTYMHGITGVEIGQTQDDVEDVNVVSIKIRGDRSLIEICLFSDEGKKIEVIKEEV